jgi:hypothetical protein
MTLSGEKQNNIITMPDTQRIVYIQYNPNTSNLKVNKRLFIDAFTDEPKVYRITNIDRVTKMSGNNGLWVLTCEEDLVGENDRPDIMIADYITEYPAPIPPPTTKGNALITNTTGTVYTSEVELKIGSTQKPFCSMFKDVNNNVVSISPLWSLINIPVELNSKIHLTYNSSYPTRCYLNVDDDASCIGYKCTLHLDDVEGTYTPYDVQIKVVSMI